jgi:hypothetical protein
MALDTINLEWFLFERISMFYVVSVGIFSSMHGAMTFWVLGKIAHKLCGHVRKEVYIIIFGVINYVASLLIPSFDWIEQLTSWEIPLRMYSIIGVPMIVLLVGLLQRRRFT